MECGPQTVPRAGEVMPDRARVEAGIDAAEENVEVGADYVGDVGAFRLGDLLSRRTPRLLGQE